MAAMGSFRIDIEIENPARRGERRKVRHALVDTGAELSWVPGDVLRSLGIEPMKQWSFRQATGQIIERWVGSVLIYAADTVTSDDVVFGEPGDLVLLGARTLEGLNVRVEPREKRLVDAGHGSHECVASNGCWQLVRRGMLASDSTDCSLRSLGATRAGCWNHAGTFPRRKLETPAATAAYSTN